MATAARKKPQGPRDPRPRPEVARPGETTRRSAAYRAFDAVFRFLASLKLAVICLGLLSASLAYGTWYNSKHGLTAANEHIYRSTGFALLLAFLAANVLCAALIRYPWTKRQTGFVITHAGLLVTILGSWWAAQAADEGQLGMREGETSGILLRNQAPMLYVKEIDPHGGKSTGEYRIPVRPGSFDWPAGRTELVTTAAEPFRIEIKEYLSSSFPSAEFVPDPAGVPMIELRPKVIPPNAKVPVDVFQDPTTRWFVAEGGKIQRAVKDQRPARFVFSHAANPTILDEFLDPPADPGREGVARLRYADRAGKERRLDLKIDGLEAGKPIPLPDSDLVASFSKVDHVPLEPAMLRALGEDQLNIVQFKVRRGDGPEVEHNGFSALPSAPPIIPKRDGSLEAEPLIRLGYYYPPAVDPQSNGRFGVIEVMSDPGGRIGYRVFGRGTPGVLGPHGPIRSGEEFTAFGGSEKAPMTMTVGVGRSLRAGRRVETAVSAGATGNDKDNAIPAMLVAMTVGKETRELWLRKSPDFDIDYRPLSFPGGVYELAFDSDRKDLGFTLTLNDFDVGFDPGTDVAASFRSEVTLDDPARKIKAEPRSIFMNNTLDHAGWRFFQSNYQRVKDKSGRETGEFISVFSVARNPARWTTYAGCIIVVLGAFVQFYMRAGVFTDGGKKQRERAAGKARRLLAAKAGRAPAGDDADLDEQL